MLIEVRTYTPPTAVHVTEHALAAMTHWVRPIYWDSTPATWRVNTTILVRDVAAFTPTIGMGSK
jgi:hypothetical protein